MCIINHLQLYHKIQQNTRKTCLKQQVFFIKVTKAFILMYKSEKDLWQASF